MTNSATRLESCIVDPNELRSVILSAIREYESICLLTHKNPDGDGLSTCLVLREIFSSYQKEVDIVLETKAPDSLDFLAAKERTVIYHEKQSYPLIIIVDCHSRSRLGKCAPLLDKAELVIAVDHHENNDNGSPSEREADLIYNDPETVSAGAIIFQAFKKEIDSFPAEKQKEAAAALYVTIINDTNNFTNKNTDSSVFQICAELCRMDIEPDEITKTFLFSKPADYFRFIGQTLATIETAEQGKVLFFHSTGKMLSENNLQADATSKVTSWLKRPQGVEVIVYFREIAADRYRLSLRSETIDVNNIAHKYKGGGHLNAAGCEIRGKLAEIQSSVLLDIKQQLR